ncbi:MAG: hypothetical protein H6706_09240 [Myxococcales bacterium]|nr:hypothetical protein [Myxococcales bacterium]
MHLLPWLIVLATPPAVPPSAPPSAPAPATAPTAAPASEAPRVTLRGRARDAKLAAAVVSDADVVYLIELPAWPADQVGKWVEVTGVLSTTDAFQAHQDATGAWTQGTAGGDRVLRAATVVVLPDP